jgi:hypothetical protein
MKRFAKEEASQERVVKFRIFISHLIDIAYFIAKCVLARKTANKLSSNDLAFILAALRQDRTYNLGYLIAFRLAAIREKGGVCGGLIASRLLALHGVAPHDLDIQFPIERLDLNSMIHYKFVSSQAWLDNLSYELTFIKKSAWRVVKSDRSVHLPAPLLFNLDGRNGWSLTENELDAYIEEHPQPVHEDGENTGDNSVQPSNTWEFPYQQSYFDYASASSSREPDYDHANNDPPAWGDYRSWD